ncbi:hypothetical protein MMC28_002949 [Mycoblastus sanguinarius]|nr:hypothetical protein [Mycoblastus sanguinarius]
MSFPIYQTITQMKASCRPSSSINSYTFRLIPAVTVTNCVTVLGTHPVVGVVVRKELEDEEDDVELEVGEDEEEEEEEEEDLVLEVEDEEEVELAVEVEDELLGLVLVLGGLEDGELDGLVEDELPKPEDELELLLLLLLDVLG